MSFNFKNIDQILRMEGRNTIDFIGIVHFCGQLKDKQLKTGGQR